MPAVLRIGHDRGRAAFLAELAALGDYADALTDEDLLAPSRCRGWVVGDVLTHVHLGLQEIFLGLASPTDRDADTDAANYWRTQPPAAELGDSQFAQIHYVRSLFSAIRRPTNLLLQWRRTADALTRALDAAPAGVLDFQDVRVSTGDFAASWAVELAVHHLDLRPDGSTLPPPVVAPEALALTRATIECLLEESLPAAWSDEQAVLIGTGRVEPDAGQHAQLGALAEHLPALG